MEDHPFDNPQPVDDTLLERIESGQEELTDQIFFKLIKDTPLYLTHWPFQKRIAQWQYCMDNPAYSTAEKEAVKKKLIKIGKTLASERRGAPMKIPDIPIHHQYTIAVEEIDKFLQEHKNDTPLERLKNFQSIYPDCSKYVDLKRHRTAREIALELIVKKYQISTRSLRTLISNPPSYANHPEIITKKPR